MESTENVKREKVKGICVNVTYNNYTQKQNGVVSLKLNSEYGELYRVVELMQMLETNVKIKARINDKVIDLGNFKINNIKVNGSGQSNIKFNGVTEDVNLNNINLLPIDENKFLIRAEEQKDLKDLKESGEAERK